MHLNGDLGEMTLFRRTVCVLGLFLLVRFGVLAEEPSKVVLWDSGKSSLTLSNFQERSGWKIVPNDLLMLEADPLKASSDPGYYGREYRFRGDAVIENQSMLAVVSLASGGVTLYSKTIDPKTNEPSQKPVVVPLEVLKIAAALPDGEAARIQLEIVRNGNDEVALQVLSGGSAILYSFGRGPIVEVKPSEAFKKFTLSAALDYAVLPAFIGDDLIYGAQDKDAGDLLCLPSENLLLLGLIHGEGSEFVLTWPKGNQHLGLHLGREENGSRSIESVQFDNDGQPFYVSTLACAGIWHRETLSAANLEKDVTSQWERPFPARWKTELFEETLKTSYAFRPSKGDIWRGVPGSYDYPVWFEGNKAFYHLSKKVPPKGESIVYFLEGQGTPESILTPADILKSTLGRAAANTILDLPGRKLRTHHRRGDEGVHRACTCGCTEAIQAVFEAGEEVERKQDIRGDLEDMLYFVHHHVDRINEYRHFADEMIRWLEENKKSSPDLGPYLDGLTQTIRQIPEEYTVQAENMKSFAYADQLFQRTMNLTEKKEPGNVKAYMELLKEWRAMGGAQDYVLAQCHVIARRLAQEAGYGCATQPKAVGLAQEIRVRVRQCLRNPDGYEIWPDY